MSLIRIFTILGILGGLSAGLVSSANAADTQTTLNQVQTLYNSRAGDLNAAVPYNTANVDKALTLLSQADQNSFEILAWSSATYALRGLYIRQTPADKLKDYEAAVQKAEAAKKINSNDAAGHYLLGVALALWMDVKGAGGLAIRPLVISDISGSLTTAKSKTSSIAFVNDELAYQSPDRVIGRLSDKLQASRMPAPGDPKKLLEDAYKLYEKHGLNVLYLAEYERRIGDQTNACIIMKKMLGYEREPVQFNDKRVPETVMEMRWVRASYKGCP